MKTTIFYVPGLTMNFKLPEDELVHQISDVLSAMSGHDIPVFDTVDVLEHGDASEDAIEESIRIESYKVCMAGLREVSHVGLCRAMGRQSVASLAVSWSSGAGRATEAHLEDIIKAHLEDAKLGEMVIGKVVRKPNPNAEENC